MSTLVAWAGHWVSQGGSTHAGGPWAPTTHKSCVFSLNSLIPKPLGPNTHTFCCRNMRVLYVAFNQVSVPKCVNFHIMWRS